jgi:hypothetical protein
MYPSDRGLTMVYIDIQTNLLPAKNSYLSLASHHMMIRYHYVRGQIYFGLYDHSDQRPHH